MPDLLEHMYCSQQINIPPNLPYILKQYAKAAIRTQPYDLLYWSAEYFRAKANNTPPPVKDRMEYPPFDSPSRLSPGFLKVLHKQLGENELVPVEDLYDRWLGVCLVKEALDSMLEVGDITVPNKVFWLKFVAVAAGHLRPSLSKTMVLICETLTDEPEGGSAKIPVEVFVNLYQFLARLDCGPDTPEGKVSSLEVEGSVASQSSRASVFSEVKGTTTIRKSVEEKDSTAGLMVWGDLMPEQKKEIILSPKYTEEPGAPSEVGIEVYDDAQGPVMDVVTIFSMQPTKSLLSIPTLHNVHSPVKTHPEIGDGELSHTSLKENDDWIQIEQKNIEEEEQSEEGVVVPIEKEVEGQGVAKSGGEEEKEGEDKEEEEKDKEEEEKDKEEEDNEEKGDEDKEEKDKDEEEDKNEKEEDKKEEDKEEEKDDDITTIETKTDSKIEVTEEIKEKSEREERSLEQTSTEVKSQEIEVTPEESAEVVKDEVSKDETLAVSEMEDLPSEDSVFKVDEKIAEHFINGEIDGSTMTYSSAEIRKGFVGEEPEDVIGRDSSENTIRAAETVQQIRVHGNDTSESILQDEPDDISKEPKRKGSTTDTESDVCEIPKKHIPGIGPVIPEPQILAVVEYMHYWASKQKGCVMPRNVNHLLCPPLDLPPSSDQSDVISISRV